MSGVSDTLQQAQAQQNALKANLQFEKNMTFFQQALPQIYTQYRNYQPRLIKPLVDKNGHFNLIDMEHNSALYPEDPDKFLRDAVTRYLKSPRYYLLNLRAKHGVNTDQDAHFKHHNAAIECLHAATNQDRQAEDDEPIHFMMVLGIGSGHHMPELIERAQIDHLCIVEPSEDCFYASLFCVDWQAIAEHFDPANKTINLIIGKSHTEYLAQVKDYIRQIGEHNAVKSYVFEHLVSEQMKASLNTFKEQLPATLGMVGYFDDEQVSIAHTVANLKKRLPVLNKKAKTPSQVAEIPVFIIANGPSLDDAREKLLAQKDHALIISCGTALGSLRKMGIKPDIHIEMERTRPVYEWITASTNASYREDIQFVGLNTVHPEVFDLFPKKVMAMKANDLGTYYAGKFVGQKKPFINLHYCNPTVANTAIALVSEMGFKKLYLFGLDLGFSPTGQHHSSLSKHYDVKKEHVESLNLYKTDDKNTIALPGNRGGTVRSNSVYASARSMITEVIRHCPELKCYNASNGVLIEGAEPIEIEAIATPPDQLDNKTEIVSNVVARHFANGVFAKPRSQQEVMSDFRAATETLNQLLKFMDEEMTTLSECYELLTSQRLLLGRLKQNDKTAHAYWLLRGSAISFANAMARALYCGDDVNDAVNLYNQIRSHYVSFLEQARERTREQLLQLDARSRNIDQKVE